jgi:hypothetical protein
LDTDRIDEDDLLLRGFRFRSVCLGSVRFGVFAAETLDAASGIEKLLLAQ